MSSPIDGGVVLVTGASSGIGREIARLVAPRAQAVVLVARRLERLADLARELRDAHASLRVEIVDADLADVAAARSLEARVRALGLDVDVLVNNAGVGLIGMFDRADPERVERMIDLNVTSLAVLTRAFVAPMVARGRGGILNVSSGFGVAALPGFAAYIGTKHFVTGFTEGLRADLAGTGVRATQVLPGPVATEFEETAGNFTGMSVPSWLELGAASCARAAVRGFDRDRARTYPGAVYGALLRVALLSPWWAHRLVGALLARPLRAAEARHAAGGAPPA